MFRKVLPGDAGNTNRKISVRGYLIVMPTAIENKRNKFMLGSIIAPLVDTLDRILRRRLKVVEFSDSPDCLFRMQIIKAEEELLLDDGTLLQMGDRLVDLHFWNEQVPVTPEDGPTLAFARRIERCLDTSLSELARYLSSHDDLADVKAIRGQMSLGSSARSKQIARIAERYGFKSFSRPKPASIGIALHRFGENILVSLLVLRRNPRAVRRDTLRRDRTLTYLSRGDLNTRYGLHTRH